MAANIVLYSNLRRNATGLWPDTTDIPQGHAAIGHWTVARPGVTETPSGKVHLWANPTGSEIVDVVDDTVAAILSAFTLQSVLENGNNANRSILLNHLATEGRVEITGQGGSASNQTIADSQGFTATSGDGVGAVRLEVSAGQIRMWETDTTNTEVLKMMFSLERGIIDLAQPALTAVRTHDDAGAVISGMESRVLTSVQAGVMRDKLNVFSKDDILEKLGTTFDFRGQVPTWAALQEWRPEDLSPGWVFQVNGPSGDNNETGLLWVWVLDDPSNPGSVAGSWQKLTFSWNMDYFNRQEVTDMLAALRGDLEADVSDLDVRTTVVEGNVSTLQADVIAVTEDLEEHVNASGKHSDYNFDLASTRKVGQLNDPYNNPGGTGTGLNDPTTVLNGVGDYVGIALGIREI